MVTEKYMNKLYEEIKAAFENYDNKRLLACEVLDVMDMEEAIIDELKDRGFEITESI